MKKRDFKVEDKVWMNC